VSGRIIFELQCIERSEPTHQAQLISALTATELRLSLLIEFAFQNVNEGIKRTLRYFIWCPWWTLWLKKLQRQPNPAAKDRTAAYALRMKWAAKLRMCLPLRT
jgi:hypothetical protein